MAVWTMRCVTRLVSIGLARLRVVSALALALLLGACQMVDTLPVLDANGETCRSAAGAYFLPKGEIHAAVTQSATNNAYGIALSLNTVADRTMSFCMDFLTSPTSDDLLVVQRNGGLLNNIHSNASDQTSAIAETLIDTGLVGITGNPNVGLRDAMLRAAKVKIGTTIQAADLIFDPFDRDRLAQINQSLASFGFCVFVDGDMFDLGATDRHGRVAEQVYCDDPVAFVAASAPPASYYKAPPPPEVLSSERYAELQSYPGIFYRANFTQKIVVMRRRDPSARVAWKLHMTKLFEMPNRSPIFTVSVDRSLFVNRDTNITFANGVLTDVTIKKPSEAAAFVDLPLRLAQAIIEIPGQIIRVRVQAVNNTQAVIDAQNQLIYNEQQYQTQLAAMRSAAVTGVPQTGPPFESATIDSRTPSQVLNLGDRSAGTVGARETVLQQVCGNPFIGPAGQASCWQRAATSCSGVNTPSELQGCLSPRQ